MLKQISANVLSWSELHGAARNEPYYWYSYLIPVPNRNILVLIDPLPLSNEEMLEFEQFGTPTHILLTNNYHLREAAAFRQRWGCEIRLHENGLKDAEARVDKQLQDGDVLWDMIEVIHIPDVSFADEVSFFVRGEGGTLIVGDALCGGRKDRGVPDGSLWVNGPEYFPDLQAARRGLSKLKAYTFERLCFAHGSPIMQRAKEKFDHLIGNDDAWAKLKVEQVERASPHSREFLKYRRQTGVSNLRLTSDCRTVETGVSGRITYDRFFAVVAIVFCTFDRHLSPALS